MFLFYLLLRFWSCHPALLYGIAFLLGLFAHFNGSVWLLFPCVSLWLPFVFIGTFKSRRFLKPLALSLFTFFTAWFYAAVYYSFPSLPPQGEQGKAHIRIKNISLQATPFGQRWVYRCEIMQFLSERSPHFLALYLPCLISLPLDQTHRHPRPLANQEFWVAGKLMLSAQGAYLLKVSSKSVWHPIPDTGSIAERRYQWKKKASDWIESLYADPASGSFLAGLVTGEFDDFWMRQQFSRFGLQHLLAISGFHFAIIASFLSFVFRVFLPHGLRMIVLLFCLGMYCFFLGPQASILRAWLMCTFTLLGSLLDKQTTALNSLGMALLIILGYDPLLCQELGFQLSFTTTAAILLFYSPALAWMLTLFPKRDLSEALQMNGWSQHAYCMLAFLRQGFALTVAVNVFALPLTLYYFHQYPWMSLLYNLFFPFMASGSLCLLLLGGIFSFIPYVGSTLHDVNDVYTFFLLQLTYQVPSEIDNYLTVEVFHSAWLIVFLCCVSLAGIIWKEKSAETHSIEEFFTFI
jgi:competence protein ComEC